MLSAGPRTASATGRVTDETCTDGLQWEPFLVEGLAQTAGLLGGGDAPAAGREGLLVGVRRLRIHRRPAAGETLRFDVELIKRLGPLTLVEGRARVADELIATGELKFYLEVG